MAVITTTLIIVTAVGVAGGVGLGIRGAVKMGKANKSLKQTKERSDNNNRKLEDQNIATCTIMDALGRNELEALDDFKTFSSLVEKINERPDFKELTNSFDLPEFTTEDIKKVSVGAGVVVGGLGGAALGTAAGFAASSATTTALVVFGAKASTGVLISSLHGAAATNATLAAIGGGSLAAGGGGMALGTAVLGAASLGVGLLIGGVIFTVTGSSIERKAETAKKEMIKNEKQINEICRFLKSLAKAAKSYNKTLSMMRELYSSHINKMERIIDRNAIEGRVSWTKLSQEEKTVIDNTILIVGVIYNMCKVQFVLETSENGLNKLNKDVIIEAEKKANSVLERF